MINNAVAISPRILTSMIYNLAVLAICFITIKAYIFSDE